MALMLIFWRSKNEPRAIAMRFLRGSARRSEAVIPHAANRVLSENPIPSRTSAAYDPLSSSPANARGTWKGLCRIFMLDPCRSWAPAVPISRPEDGISAAIGRSVAQGSRDLAKESSWPSWPACSFGLMMLNNIERFRVRPLEAGTGACAGARLIPASGTGIPIKNRDLKERPSARWWTACARF